MTCPGVSTYIKKIILTYALLDQAKCRGAPELSEGVKYGDASTGLSVGGSIPFHRRRIQRIFIKSEYSKSTFHGVWGKTYI